MAEVPDRVAGALGHPDVLDPSGSARQASSAASMGSGSAARAARRRTQLSCRSSASAIAVSRRGLIGIYLTDPPSISPRRGTAIAEKESNVGHSTRSKCAKGHRRTFIRISSTG